MGVAQQPEVIIPYNPGLRGAHETGRKRCTSIACQQRTEPLAFRTWKQARGKGQPGHVE